MESRPLLQAATGWNPLISEDCILKGTFPPVHGVLQLREPCELVGEMLEWTDLINLARSFNSLQHGFSNRALGTQVLPRVPSGVP